MSVYTAVEHAQLVEFLSRYSVGTLVSFQGIESGIENTNYFVTTTEGKFVLTLFEELSAEELPYFLDIMAFFSAQGIPSADPITLKNGDYLSTLNGKPAALVIKLNGTDVENPTVEQCATMGATMAKLHLASQQLTLQRENRRNAAWRQQTGELMLPHLDKQSAELLRDELDFQSNYTSLALPSSVIHADLFKDNALFSGEQLEGVIDFYYACNDYLMYDIAVAVNDWCIEENGLLDKSKFNSFIQAYQAIRPFTDAEIEHWPTVIRAAALRFWLSRLKDFHFPKEGEMTHIKDPKMMRKVLLSRREQPENYRINYIRLPLVLPMLSKIINSIDSFNQAISNTVSWLTVLMVFTMFFIVLLRYAFNIGSILAQESITYMHGLIFMLAIAHTLKINGHVRVDIFYQRWGEKGQAVVNLIGSICLLLPVCIFIAYISSEYVAASWAIQEGSREAGGLDAVFLLKSLIPAAAVLLLLQGIAEILRAVCVLMRPTVSTN